MPSAAATSRAAPSRRLGASGSLVGPPDPSSNLLGAGSPAFGKGPGPGRNPRGSSASRALPMRGLHSDMYPVFRSLLAAIPAAAALLCAPSARAADCNANGEDDLAEIAAGTASDCNLNGVPDPCDVAPSRPALIVQSRFDLLLAAASALAIGDLDGNGRPDVITGAPGGGVGLHIYSRDVSGSFLPPARVSVLTEEVTAVEAGDIDGDGDLDVAVTAAGSLRVAWLD